MDNKKKQLSKGFTANSAKAGKINASTEYESCDEQLNPFGGLLAVIKFCDLVKFKEIFNYAYHRPIRRSKLARQCKQGGKACREISV